MRSDRLERLAPFGLPEFGSGDLLARLIHDVDSLQDLMLRVLPPFAIALTVGAATVGLVWWMLPAAGLILLVCLLVAATLGPWLAGRLAERSEARQAAARARLTGAVVDLIEGAPEIAVNGAGSGYVGRALEADAELTRVARSSASTAGVGQALMSLCTGFAMWGALLVGVAAVHAGHMNGVLLAGIALIPLVAFELIAPLPGAAQTLQRVRRSSARVLEVLHTPEPVVEPAHPMALAPGPHRLRVRGLQASYPGASGRALAGVDLDLWAGRRVAVVGASGAGKTTLAAVLARLLSYEGGSVTLDGVALDQLAGDDCRRVVGLVSQDAHIFDTTLEENLLTGQTRGEHRGELRSTCSPEGPPCSTGPSVCRTALQTELGERGARDVRRPTPAPGDRASPCLRLPGADRRRAGGASRHRHRGCDHRGSAGDHPRASHIADHAPSGGARRRPTSDPGPRSWPRSSSAERMPRCLRDGGRYAELWLERARPVGGPRLPLRRRPPPTPRLHRPSLRRPRKT